MGYGTDERSDDGEGVRLDEALREAGEDLNYAVLASIDGWIGRCLARVGLRREQLGDDFAETVKACRAWLDERLAALLGADVDAQHTTPLALLRAASAFATELARVHGAIAVPRSDEEVERFADDIYGFAPSTWSDIDDDLVEPGLRWGVTKAYAHRQRHSRPSN